VHFFASADKAKRVLGWQPQHDFLRDVDQVPPALPPESSWCRLRCRLDGRLPAAGPCGLPCAGRMLRAGPKSSLLG
jgi:hypothetical protein